MVHDWYSDAFVSKYTGRYRLILNNWLLLTVLYCYPFKDIRSFTRWLFVSKHASWESFIWIWNLQMEITIWLIHLKLLYQKKVDILYVKIHYSVPERVQQLTGITNSTIKTLGLLFREVIDGLVEFLHREQEKGYHRTWRILTRLSNFYCQLYGT